MNKQKLEFGTAGIRGIVGEREDQLNIQHVLRIADGLAKYVKKHFDKKDWKIVIGRDNRIMSYEFAHIAANLLSLNGIKVIFSKDICPTPVVSYLIKKYEAAAGMNITASHNPKEYNGIKIYNNSGNQALPDEIENLIACFEPYEAFANYDISKGNIDFIFEPSIEIFNEYIEKVLKLIDDRDCSNISVAYSPQHGTGAYYARYALPKLTNKYYFLESQMTNDPNFTNTKTPNPENIEAYEQLIELGNKNNCDIIITTDPDSDRVGIGIKQEDTYKIINGNETATIIFKYLIDSAIESNIDLSHKYMIYSYVSSNLPAIIAKKHEVKIHEVPTGFKWIGSLIAKLDVDEPDMSHLFSFEESYGSLIDKSLAYDKDAIQSLLILVKIASFYKRKNMDLLDVLENIYKEYGYVSSKTLNISTKNYDLNSLMSQFKTIEPNEQLIDYNLDSNPTNMLKIVYKDNSWVALRPSGTEPKIKFYIFAFGKEQKNAENKVNSIEEKIKNIL